MVIHAQDLKHVVTNPVGKDEGRLRDNEFARSRNASGMTKVRILREKMLNAIEDVKCDALGG